MTKYDILIFMVKMTQSFDNQRRLAVKIIKRNAVKFGFLKFGGSILTNLGTFCFPLCCIPSKIPPPSALPPKLL